MNSAHIDFDERERFIRKQMNAKSRTRTGLYIFVGTLLVCVGIASGMEIGWRQHAAEAKRQAVVQRTPDTSEIPRNESCIEKARACYAQQRKERAKGKEG